MCWPCLLPNPSSSDGTINVVAVPREELALYAGMASSSGDILKYYVKEDETVDEESRRSGFARRTAMELTIAQVLDDQSLLIEGGLSPDIDIDVLLLEAVPQLGELAQSLRWRRHCLWPVVSAKPLLRYRKNRSLALRR